MWSTFFFENFLLNVYDNKPFCYVFYLPPDPEARIERELLVDERKFFLDPLNGSL